MKIVITGATGLIGSMLMERLQSRAEVVGLTRGESSGAFSHTDYSTDSLSSAFEQTDIVVHLAAVRGKGNDYSHFINNAVLTENVLKAALQAKVGRVIFMSSIAVYSDVELVPWREEQSLQPQTFYGLSKITGEHLCQLYSRKGLDFTIFRCGIVLGITKNNRMTDIFIQNAAAGKEIVVTGKSVARRDFIYLKDVVNALCWSIFEEQKKNQIYNLGSGNAYTNLQLAEAINRAFGNEGNLSYLDDRSEGIEDSRMDSAKLEEAGFRRAYDLNSALDDIRKEWEEAAAHDL